MASIQYDNIFDAITEDKQKANELKIRADFILAIRNIINEKDWDPAEVADRLSITQKTVSNLVNGKVDLFSIDTLIIFLYRLGYRLEPKYENENLTISVRTS